MLLELMNTYAPAELAAKNYAGAAQKINAARSIVRDPTPLTYARVRELFGEQVRQLVAHTIRQAAKGDTPLAGELADVHTVMLDERVGFRIDLDERQAVLRAVGASAGWDPALVNQLAALGVREVPVATVTEAECQAAAYAAERLQVYNDTKAKFDAAMNKIGTVEHAAGVAELHAIANELE